MTYRFPLLGDAAYMGYTGEIRLRGTNVSSHLAEIRYPNQQKPVVSVVKFLPPDGLLACNEAIAWLFLRAAGIPCPPNAALLSLTQNRAAQAAGAATAKRYAHQGYVLAWATQALDFKAVAALFAGTAADAEWSKMIRSTQGAAIAAFDEALLNTDRNNGNLLVAGPGRCIPIDHEGILARHAWLETDIPRSRLQSDTVRRIHGDYRKGMMSADAYRHLCSQIVVSAEAHAGALTACDSGVRDLLARVYPQQGEIYAARVLSFVVERTMQGWMNDRLGVL